QEAGGKQAPSADVARRRALKPQLGEEDYDLLKRWLDYIRDDRVWLMRYNLEPRKLKLLRELVGDPANFVLGGKSLKDLDLLMQRLSAYLDMIAR
ncbi:MAG: hypothetical protein ACPL5F_07245, partial [Moorellaceae bacterium]